MRACEPKFDRNDIKLSPMGEAPEAGVTREILRQRSNPRYMLVSPGRSFVRRCICFEAQGVDISRSEDEIQ
jgi:hypothetical protein